MAATSEIISPLGTASGRLFGGLLLGKGLITPEDLQKALDDQREHGGRLGEVLLRL